MFELRPYQKELVEELKKAILNGHRSICAVLGCGGGKSVIIGDIVKSATAKKNRVLFLVHRKELVKQITGTFADSGVDMNYCSCMMVQTATRRIVKLSEPRIIVVDEAHHILSKSYTNIIEHFPKATVLGFTATPQRMNEGGLGKVFTTLVESVSTQWLIDNHYLAPFKPFSIPLADTSKLHIKRGEFDPEEVERLMSQGTIFGGTYSNWERLAKGKKTIVYCSSIRTSKATAAVFQAHGISAMHLDGTTAKTTRDNAVQDFRDGKIMVLTNVDLFGEGFDVPDCECVVLLRPTKSLTLHIQQSMRSMRYKEGKTAIILDHVGNFFRHGLPTEVHEWTLAEKKNKQKSEVHIKECPNCFAALPTNAQVCSVCGYSFMEDDDDEEDEEEEKQTVECELTEFKGRPLNRYTDCHNMDELMQYAKKKGYKPFYAAYKAIEMGISFPPKYMWMKRWIERHAK